MNPGNNDKGMFVLYQNQLRRTSGAVRSLSSKVTIKSANMKRRNIGLSEMVSDE